MPPAAEVGSLAQGKVLLVLGGRIGCASALRLPLERRCWLEVLPPTGRPRWQNKQGGSCLCGQIEPSRRSEYGRSHILFHPGWDGGLETEGTI